METTERLAALLRERGADGIEHPGGTLGGHLERVQQRLAGLGLPLHVQLAGRAHAVYGTQGFDVRLLADDERPLLAGIVGPDAEELVHRYGACDRGATWAELATARRVHDRHTGAVEDLDGDRLRAFADLSLVNEIDVAEHAPGFLGQHGPYFRQLTEDWAPVLSPAVLAEARRAFA
ncbi:hypothetical protein DQ244_03280 [Blastococcus sp. TBT05-19]|uniref:DUF6817 domain-containing protein n=1 Tax=Blastococcus sp. TBT05-19 TaxID=2250581 RepID=UPI000DEBD35F|nr:hypothetical protein [Blastococcus sp. TBT05-19]RBY94359.1 hypothetical protein DQ244_03280 [Blastococcus sp. TBT05-19]